MPLDSPGPFGRIPLIREFVKEFFHMKHKDKSASSLALRGEIIAAHRGWETFFANMILVLTACCILTFTMLVGGYAYGSSITSENFWAYSPESPQPLTGSQMLEATHGGSSMGGASTSPSRMLAQDANTGETASRSESAETSISERVRKAADLIQEGDNARADEIIRTTIRECENNQADRRQCAQWMKSLRGIANLIGKPKEKVAFSNSVGMEMVRIPAGEYMMGSLPQEMDWLRLTFKSIWRDGHKQWFQDELPLHPVRITRPFYLGATEVTVGQFQEFVQSTGHKTEAEKGDGGMIWSNKEYRWVPKKGMKWSSPPWRISDHQPVVFVSFNDAQAFCQWLSRKEKRTYRLPTEAEWEMACRGGSVWVRFPWGNRLPGDHDLNFGDGNPKLPESLTTVSDGHEFVSPVKSYPPNGFGLYDMDGNVMEWVQDRYGRDYYASSPLEDPKGPDVGTGRVNKGGNFFASPADCRCAFRGFSGPEMSFWNLGFRVVMEEKEEPVLARSSRTDAGEGSARKPQVGEANLPPTDADGMRTFREAMFAAQQQQWDNAIDDLEKALKIYEKRQDHLWVARVKATLAGIYAERNRRHKGKELYTQALAEFRKIGDTASARILLARLNDLETSPGVQVAEVQKGSLAEKAGIVKGDIIIEYAGETGFRVTSFKQLVDEYSRTENVTLSVINNGEITTTVVPGGTLGVAVEDIKRPPRPRAPQPDRQRRQDRRRAAPRPAAGGR